MKVNDSKGENSLNSDKKPTCVLNKNENLKIIILGGHYHNVCVNFE